jgi:putative transposase
MRENGLQALQRRRFKRTTDSEHAWPIAPNVIDQDFTATGPNEKWGVDISYLWTREGWLYLAVVIDLFSRLVVGWAAVTGCIAIWLWQPSARRSRCGVRPRD